MNKTVFQAFIERCPRCGTQELSCEDLGYKSTAVFVKDVCRYCEFNLTQNE